jgi:hypothetical protein
VSNGKRPAANTARNQRGRPFPKGVSGNPAGKPKGTKHRRTILTEMLTSDDLDAAFATIGRLAKRNASTAKWVADWYLKLRTAEEDRKAAAEREAERRREDAEREARLLREMEALRAAIPGYVSNGD